MFKNIILFLFIFQINCFSQSFDKTKLNDLFSQGKEYFHKANEIYKKNPEKAKQLYQKAVLRFESIVKYGNIANGKLYYNIGNIYLLMGDIGKSILYYRRAMLFIPYDQNLIQNIAYARQQCIDKIPVQQQEKVLKTIFFWHYDIPSKYRLYMFLFLFASIWIFMSIRIYYKKTFIHWIIGISIILSLSLLSSLLVNLISEINYKSGVIIEKEVIARKGDGENYEKSFKQPLHAGVEFELIEDRGKWIYIELSDRRRCWINRKTAEFISDIK